MHYLQVCCIVKDEPDFSEWLAYYLILGVERFVIYDNGSLRPVRSNHPSIKVIRWPGAAQQIAVYHHFTRNFLRDAVWSGVFDADEFVLPHCCDDLRELLCGYQEYSGLAVNWQCFGSNGHKQRPGNLVIESYTRRAPVHFSVNRHVKIFLRSGLESVRWPDPHHVELPQGSPPVVNEVRTQVDGPFVEPSVTRIQINHYGCRSEEDMALKNCRGSVSCGGERRWEVIRSLDQNQEDDTRITRFAPKVRSLLTQWE